MVLLVYRIKANVPVIIMGETGCGKTSLIKNISRFQVGTKAKGIVRETEKNKNGIFIELTPNLVGMAEYTDKYTYGQEIDVFIKKIIPEKKKIKLEII